MQESTRQQTQAFYNRLSRWYDALGGAAEKEIAFKAISELYIQMGDMACEIGFGTGHALCRMAQLVGETGYVFGIDLSPKMAARASARISGKDLSPRVCIGIGDAVELPFDRNTFDVVFMSFTLELFPNTEIPRVLQECKRVLRKDGRLGLVSLSKNGPERWMRDVYEWAHWHFPAWIDCRPFYVHQAVLNAGFSIHEQSLESLWGLPVEIVIARK